MAKRKNTKQEKSNPIDQKEIVDLYPRTIFEEVKQNKGKARSVLEHAKKMEQEKIKAGYHYVLSEDGKTAILTKPK